METQLYFWRPLIETYQKDIDMVGDYFKRTSAVFNDMDTEIKAYAEELLDNYPGSEDTDLASVAEWAQNRAIDKYQILSKMKSNHLLMTISMLYHVWEQQLIQFAVREIKRYLHFEKKTVSFGDVQLIFKLHNVDIVNTQAWKKLRELKNLANTVKHGDGKSADKLRKMRPDFFEIPTLFGTREETDTLELYGAVLLDQYSLQVSENDLYLYIDATKNFWDEMPERAYSDTDTLIKEFEKTNNGKFGGHNT